MELRYRGEIRALTDRVVSSPIDAMNRPSHTGDFSVRVPPSAEDLAAFLAAWRAELGGARKWLVATRNYTMARVAADVGLRVRELCGLALDDLHFEHGPVGKVHVETATTYAAAFGPFDREANENDTFIRLPETTRDGPTSAAPR